MDLLSIIITAVIVLIAAVVILLVCYYMTRGLDQKMEEVLGKVDRITYASATTAGNRTLPNKQQSPGETDCGIKIDKLSGTLNKISTDVLGTASSVSRNLETRLSALDRIPEIKAGIEAFDRTLSDFRSVNDELRAECESTKKSLDSVSVKLQTSKSEADDLRLKIKNLNEEKVDADELLKKSYAECERVQAELKQSQNDLKDATSRLKQLEEGARSRLSNLLSKGILDSPISLQVEKLYAESALGKEDAIRAMAALFQLRSSMLPGSGPDDALAALKTLGSALHAVWSAQGQSPKDSHALFTQWRGVLCDLPGISYQLVVPDLGQGVPQNVTAPAGVTKVTEVQLWIIKSANGSVYARGIVR